MKPESGETEVNDDVTERNDTGMPDYDPELGDRRRSHKYFGQRTMYSVIRNGHMHALGFPRNLLREGRPLIGIANTESDLNPCNVHFGALVENIKAGVWEAGGVPVVFPTMSLGEVNMLPTTMMFRNLASMELEEMIRASPIDAVVLLGGCDKTVPAALMGAASVDLPTILMSGGPMLTGYFRGENLGTGTTARRMADRVRAGTMTADQFFSSEVCYARSNGHCMVMGTGSTMGSVGEALGMQLPGSSSIPAPETGRKIAAHEVGRRIVAMAEEDLRMSKVLTRDAFENAIKVSAALSGSTNAVVHLLALAGRIGAKLSLDDFDTWGADVPWLANLQPAGQYFMEDFNHAGGLPALMKELSEHLVLDAMTITGRTLGENIAAAECFNDDVIRPVDRPLDVGKGTAVLRGNLAPDGAIIKQAAASEHLMTHTGPAVVFDSIDECELRINDEDLDIDENSVLVVRNVGPKGYPGMPEVGNLPVPHALLRRGINDIVRISDSRMSGTAYGTVVLHVAPEAAFGGNLALVRTGDLITLDVPARSLHLHVSDEELEQRRKQLRPKPNRFERGWAKLYVDHVLQADQGADLDFLVGGSGAEPYADPATHAEQLDFLDVNDRDQ